MSKENHPNIQAVALTCDIINSVKKHLRGKGKEHEIFVMSDGDIGNKICDFVVDISTTIDKLVENK